MARHAHLRKKLYVSRAIQGRILIRVAIYWILYHLCMWHVLFLSSDVFIGSNVISFSDAYSAFLWDNRLLLACAVVGFPLVLHDMLRLTNRVAGPFVRFERALRAMTEGGRVEPVTLRKDDLVQEFQGVFNEFIEYRNREQAQLAEAAARSEYGSTCDSNSRSEMVSISS